MTRRLLAALATLVCAAGAVLLPGLAVPAHAVEICGQYDTVNVNGKEYVVQNNVWGASTAQCIDVNGTSFRVTRSDHKLPTNGSPASYPSIFKGCHWGDCTTGSGLPLRVDSIGSARSSWSVSTPSSGAWDVAYDLWFNSTPSTTGQPDGAELMIWLNSRGGVQPGGSIVAGNVSIAGATWNVWYADWAWNYIAYQRTSPTNSVTDLDVNAIIQDARRRGYIQPSWYFIDAEAGFELWQGGAGLATNSFSFTASSGSPNPDPTPTPTTPPPGNPGCTVSYRVQNQWQGGFTADVTIRNDGSALNGWNLTWTFPGDQRITSAWNAAVTQNGQQVTARDLGWNGNLPSGGATSFGFQASYSGSNPTPAGFQLNGTTCATS